MEFEKLNKKLKLFQKAVTTRKNKRKSLCSESLREDGQEAKVLPSRFKDKGINLGISQNQSFRNKSAEKYKMNQSVLVPNFNKSAHLNKIDFVSNFKADNRLGNPPRRANQSVHHYESLRVWSKSTQNKGRFCRVNYRLTDVHKARINKIPARPITDTKNLDNDRAKDPVKIELDKIKSDFGKFSVDSQAQSKVDNDYHTSRTVKRKDLENQVLRKNSDAKIKKFIQKIQDLEQENTDLRDYNRKLLKLEDNSSILSTDVHTFYQDVFITDLNKQIDKNNQKEGEYKKQITEQAIIIEKLQKEVQHLNKVLNRYRNIVNELTKKENGLLKSQNLQRLGKPIQRLHSMIGNDHDDSSILDDESSVQFEAPLSITSGFNQKTMLPGNDASRLSSTISLIKQAKAKKSNRIKLDMINNCLSAISKTRHLNNMIDIFKQKVRLLVNVDQVNVILTNNIVVDAFNKEKKGYTQPIKLEECTIFRAMENRTGNKHTQDNDNFRNFYCGTFEEAFIGQKGKNYMISPIKDFSATKKHGHLSKYPMYAIVQVERTKKNSPKFEIKENQILDSLCLMMSSCIQRVQNTQDCNRKEERVMHLLKTFRQIAMERNHVNIYNKIIEYVPKIMNVEKAGLFMTDPADKKSMYNISTWEKDSSGVPYITQVARYPSNVGLTGICMMNKEVIRYDKDKTNLIEEKGEKGDKGRQGFISEIDNYMEAGTIHNALYGPLIDDLGKPVGCIQLLNKKGKAEFTDTDLEEFQTILDVTAATVDNSNESLKGMNLVTSLLQTIQTIHSLFSNDLATLANLHEIEFVANIKLIKEELSTLVDSKKKQFFRDGVLLEEYFSQVKGGSVTLKDTIENDIK
ncbi:unnamed protein product [Moneuplotes crassus]|uniref:GAF domain-containing protein n=2 Tax=Euplotes crassus TaxID=5936 RepID=A0AAD2D704_EUPCR|nr:unnamed protein product [Moneuplotes crassus]